jgi:predicted  nucleic acid-binding Zn-ribbon protein
MFNSIVSFIERADDGGTPRRENELEFSPEPVTKALEDRADAVEVSKIDVSPIVAANTQRDDRALAVDDSTNLDFTGEPQHDHLPKLGSSGVATRSDANEIALPSQQKHLALASLSLQLARRETEVERCNRRALAAEATAQELTQLIAAKDAALQQLLRVQQADSSPDDETRFQAITALGSASDPTVVRLRLLVEHQAAALRELEDRGAKNRAEILAVATATEELETLNRQLETSCRLAAEAAERSHSDLATAKKEVARLSAKVNAMRVSLEDVDAKHKAAQREVDAATAQILRRDNELSLLRQHGSAPTKELRHDPVVSAVAKGKWGSRAVSLMTMFDVLVLRFGRLLRAHAMLRLIAAVYIAVLHLYVFNAVMVFLHHTNHMPDHMGDDVHDHIANHVHH